MITELTFYMAVMSLAETSKAFPSFLLTMYPQTQMLATVVISVTLMRFLFTFPAAFSKPHRDTNRCNPQPY